MQTSKTLYFSVAVLGVAVLGLSACGGIKTEAKYPTGMDRNQTGGENNIYGERTSIFGDGGIAGFNKKKKNASAGDSGIGVNSFLWRATLDTVSFMPLASADPFGGVILTDWYIDPVNPNERVKLNAFVLSRELEASGIRVRAFRQVLGVNGWADAPVAEDTARKLEDTVLTRARQLRIAHLAK